MRDHFPVPENPTKVILIDRRQCPTVGPPRYDAAWSSGAVRDDVPPPRLTTALLGQTGPYRETLNTLHRLWARNPEVIVTPSHCGEVEIETGRAD
mgnify:CR=1 FL=1